MHSYVCTSVKKWPTYMRLYVVIFKGIYKFHPLVVINNSVAFKIAPLNVTFIGVHSALDTMNLKMKSQL